MKYKSIIKEGEVTKANRLYPSDALESIRELFLPSIERNICFVVLGSDRDAFLTYNGLDPSYLSSDKAIANGLYCGIVKGIEREEGRLAFDIEPISTPAGDRLKLFIELGHEFSVDFYVRGSFLFSSKDNAEVMDVVNEVLPIVVLTKGE